MTNECSQADLNTLSSLVVYVYGGKGSFSDYAPGAYDPVSERYTPTKGAEHFDELSSKVYEEARALWSEIPRTRRFADAVLRITSFAVGLVVGASAGALILYWPALFHGKYMLAWGWVGMPLGFVGAIYVCFDATRKIYRFSSKQLWLT